MRRPEGFPAGAGSLKSFMEERHEMYIRRFVRNEPPPWSEDPAMRLVFLTNVYRELDRVTIWIRENIREPFAESKALWHMLTAARLVNLPETLEELIKRGVWEKDRFHRERFEFTMKSLQDEGKKIYTNAYMLWGGLDKGRPKWDLQAEHLELMWDMRDSVEAALGGTLHEAWAELLNYPSLGGFVAYEVVCDLRYTRYLRDAPDIMTWTHPGPGAKRGLNWILGRDREAPISMDKAIREMVRLHEKIAPEWPHDPPLELREIEHSLCEYDKLVSYKILAKRPKRFYQEPRK